MLPWRARAKPLWVGRWWLMMVLCVRVAFAKFGLSGHLWRQNFCVPNSVLSTHFGYANAFPPQILSVSKCIAGQKYFAYPKVHTPFPPSVFLSGHRNKIATTMNFDLTMTLPAALTPLLLPENLRTMMPQQQTLHVRHLLNFFTSMKAIVL